jgi:hypothetical protein
MFRWGINNLIFSAEVRIVSDISIISDDSIDSVVNALRVTLPKIFFPGRFMKVPDGVSMFNAY